MLSVEHVTKRYGKFTALEDVNLIFQPGVYGLLAPNGAGKTTLIKLLATLLFPTRGKILWDGEDIHALGAEYRGLLGYLPQDFGFYPDFTAREFMLILSRLVDTFISRISLTMLPVPNPHNTVCVLSGEEARHWQSRSSGYSSS